MRLISLVSLVTAASALLCPNLNTQTPPLFQPAQRGIDVPYVEEYTFLVQGDFDKDGDLDVFAASSYVQHRLFLNDGKGVFTDGTAGRLPAIKKNTVDHGVAAGDIDGDGDLDLVISRGDWDATPDPLEVWINDGTGKFQELTSSYIPAISCRIVGLVDVDGDKDLDLLYGSSGKQNGLLLNNGSGVFTDVTATHMPVDTDHPFCFTTGDVDKDGDLDIVFGNWRNSKPYEQVDTLYLNDGSGKFTLATGKLPTTATPTRGINLFDWEGDGDLDLIVALGNHYEPAKDLLYLNDGHGKFVEDTTGLLPTFTRGSRSYKIFDADKDGDLDLFAPGTGQSRLFRNDGSGSFTDVTAAKLPVDTNRNRTAVVGDMDGDGDIDLFLSSGNQLRLLRNDGSGGFSTRFDHRFPFQNMSAESCAFGDIDGDGDLDIALACYPMYPDMPFNNKLFVNDGRGRFTEVTATQLPKDTNPSTAVLFLDIDGDLDNDLLFTNEAPAPEVVLSVYLNNGSGVFTDATATYSPAVSGFSYGIEAADFDKDGDMDLFLANWGQNYLFLNNGGKFVDATTRLPARDTNDETRGVAVGDIDGDGDIDIVVGNGFFYERDVRILLNDGHANFTDATGMLWPGVKDVTLDVVLGDVDGDGDLDLYEATGIDPVDVRKDHLYLNDGFGRFTEVTSTRMPWMQAGRTFSAVMDDFDGDGDLDVYAGHSHYIADVGAKNGLYLNSGNGMFMDYTDALPDGKDHTNWLAVGDVDGDGDLDVLGASYYFPQLYLNLMRHDWAPKFPDIGTVYQLELYGWPVVTPSKYCLAIPFLSAGPGDYPFPPFGVVGIDPLSLVVLQMVVIQPNTGKAVVELPIPNEPGFVGISFYSQGLVIPDLNHPFGYWRLTNTLHEKFSQ